MPLILTGLDTPARVRSKLGVDSGYLPDDVILSKDFLDVAEYNIIELVPNYAELTDEKKAYLETATVCEVAQLIAPTMPARLPVREQGPHVTYEVSVDWEKKQRELQDERDTYLAKITTQIEIPYFGLAGPNR